MRIELTYMTKEGGADTLYTLVILCKRNTTPKPVPLWEQTHTDTRGGRGGGRRGRGTGG